MPITIAIADHFKGFVFNLLDLSTACIIQKKKMKNKNKSPVKIIILTIFAILSYMYTFIHIPLFYINNYPGDSLFFAGLSFSKFAESAPVQWWITIFLKRGWGVNSLILTLNFIKTQPLLYYQLYILACVAYVAILKCKYF